MSLNCLQRFKYTKLIPSTIFNCKRYNTSIETNGKLSSINNLHDELDPVAPQNEHLKFLKSKFGHESFKSIQWSIIKSILYNQQDNYVSLPMGYGKSLCYQYPAVYKNGLAIIISPLISLMQDQVRLLKANDIPSCYLAHIQSNRNDIIDRLYNGEYRLLYITPESAFTSFGLQLLHSLNATNNLTLFAVDEAHCILHWGKHFRPSYQKLINLRSEFPTVPIMALTATATVAEKDSIVELLGMRNPNITCDGYDRSNLYFMAQQMSCEPFGDIIEVLNTDTLQHNIEDGSVIIYCLTVRSCKKIAKTLNAMNILCQEYHSELGYERRKIALDNFMNDKIKIMVATSAFGMGINKNNVRIVIHYGTPLNLENYYQEVGRAGRDNKQALCKLYYNHTDFTTHRYLGAQNSKSNENIRCNEEKSSIMRKYITNPECRRKFILSHFGASDISNTEQNLFCCDNCTINKHKIIENLCDCSNETELFLRMIESFYPKTFGIKTIISMLIGIRSKKILHVCQGNKFYGLGNGKCVTWWKYLALFLETENFIKVNVKMSNTILYPKAVIDEKGKIWLRDRLQGNVSPLHFDINFYKQDVNSG